MMKKLRERCKRTVLRKIEAGEVTYDKARKLFVYKDTEEEYKVEAKEGEEGSDDDSEKDESGDNSDEEGAEK